MPSERIQAAIDTLFKRLDEALAAGDWSGVERLARDVLALDQENEDALALLRAAAERLGQSGALAPQTDATTSRADAGVSTGRPMEAPPAAPALIAGRYELRNFIGEGARKRVYLGHDRLLDRDVALALLKTEGIEAPGLDRLAREAQAMGRLGSHPNLVAVYDIIREPPCIVQEHFAGGTLSDELAAAGGRGLAVERALRVAVGVARALAFIHAQQLVHRDLKPGNVFLAADGTPKVGDFGLAVAIDRTRIAEDASMVGTAT